ncbi:MAG: DUF4395 family protein [Sulfurimonas sp.]|jgi:hypothetical protein|nr:DUF4395 family protein [Sulfurimonas sp.]
MLNKQNYELSIVNGTQERVYSGIVALLLGLYLFGTNEIFLYILICDFFVKIYISSQISPISTISTFLVKIMNLKDRPTDALAKMFASHVGLTLLVVALLIDLSQEIKIAFLMIVCFAIWKLLDATREFCFACRFYEFLKRKNIEVESL